MKNLIAYLIIILLAALFVVAQCSQPDINEKRKQCNDACAKRGLFGTLEGPAQGSTRQTPADYSCRCY